MKLEHCPVCRYTDNVEAERISGKLMYECSCPRCGKFTTSHQFVEVEKGSDPHWYGRHLISGLIRELNERKEEVPPIIQIEKLLKHPLIPADGDYKSKTQKIINYLKAQTVHYGQNVSFQFDKDRSIAYAWDDEELGALLSLLVESGIVAYGRDPFSSSLSVDLDSHRETLPPIDRMIDEAHGVLGNNSVGLRLTAKGWDLMSELGKKPVDSKQGFVAIRFDDLDEKDSVDGCIAAISEGIRKAGYEPNCIKTKIFSEAIMNKALTDISQSKFVVVDLTGERTAVAFEAGYAHCLGLDVIYVYQAVRGRPKNFYAAHYQLLPYDKAEDLIEIVFNAIRSYYPR